MSQSFIICDDRERNGAIDCMENALYKNNNHNKKLSYVGGGGDISYVVQRCEVGDYIISIPSDVDSSHYITAMIIERKTWKDLAASISDKRCDSQHTKMLNIQKETGCLVYYIIEGAEPRNGRIPINNLYAKLRKNTIRGTPFLQSKNTTCTAEILINLTRDIMKLYRKKEIEFPLQEPRFDPPDIEDFTKLLEKYKNHPLSKDIENLLVKAEVLARPWEKSAPLLKSVATRTTKTPDEIYMNMWRALKGVGPETANLLSQHYTISQIFLQTPSIKELCKLKYESGSKISNSTINKIVKSATDRNTHIDMLSQISGITTNIASFILDNISMVDLWNGNCDAKKISELILPSGQKVSNRIYKILEITCPNYRQPLPALDKNSQLFKVLERFGDPQELRYYIKNVEISNKISFNAIDENYEYPEPIVYGVNEFENYL